MGVATFQTMRTNVWLMMDTRSDLDPGTALGLARLNLFINKAYAHCALPNVHDHPELVTSVDIAMVAGTRSYSISRATLAGLAAPPLYAIKHLYDVTRGRRIRPMTLRQMLERHFDTVALTPAGRPNRYTRFAETLLLDRYPTATEAGQLLTLYYWREISPMTLDADTTLFSQPWDQVVEAGAAYYGWVALNNSVRADLARDNFGRLINEVGSIGDLEGMDEGYRIDLDPDIYMERSP